MHKNTNFIKFSALHDKDLIFEEAVRACARARAGVRAFVRVRECLCVRVRVRECVCVRVRAGACAYRCLKLRLPGFSIRPWCAHLCGSVQA